jgi:putative Mg2+ transporter-C (MgtC) family protein
MGHLMYDFFISDFGKLLLAVFCASLIGWERERREKAAGLKTHVLISFGACLFTIVGIRFTTPEASGELLRVFQGIVTGVGFVGAGAIIRQGMDVRGVTTAAGIWVIAAVGMAAGAGAYDLALYSSVCMVIMLRFFGIIESKIQKKKCVERRD